MVPMICLENRWPVYLLYQIRIQAPQEISSSDGVEKPKDTRLRKVINNLVLSATTVP